MRHFITSFMLLLSCTTIIQPAAASTRAARLEKEAAQASQKYAIALDLDGVVFEPVGTSTYVKALWHISFSIYKPAFRQLKVDKGSLNTWRLLCLQQGDIRGAQFFEGVIRSKEVYDDTEKIIKRLHKKGYPLFYASNISKDEIDMHSERSETRDLFSCFTDGVKVDDAPGKRSLKKPSAAYFDELKEIMTRACGPDVRFVFIDDKLENVQAAQRAGFIGIHCKKPEQLWKQLRHIGIRF
jgi:FMN phosphatase YigB (HAD superfamily)